MTLYECTNDTYGRGQGRGFRPEHFSSIAAKHIGTNWYTDPDGLSGRGRGYALQQTRDDGTWNPRGDPTRVWSSSGVCYAEYGGLGWPRDTVMNFLEDENESTL